MCRDTARRAASAVRTRCVRVRQINPPCGDNAPGDDACGAARGRLARCACGFRDGRCPGAAGAVPVRADFGSNSVTVIDTPTNTTVPPAILVGISPFTAGVRGDGSLVYVANNGTNNVSAIDTATNTVVATIAVGNTPVGVTVSPDGTRVYAANQDSNTVSVINTANNTVVATVLVGGAPQLIAFSPDGTRAYVANSSVGNVSVIDTSNNTVVATIGAGIAPTGVAVSPNGTRAYVTNGATNNVPSSTPPTTRWWRPFSSETRLRELCSVRTARAPM